MFNWEERLKQLLRRGKVTQVALLDPEGQPLASIPDLSIATGEGQGLVKAATCSSYSSSFILTFAGTRFTCFCKAQGALVGTAGEEELVLAANKTRGGHFVVGLANTELPGSCLYEVSEFARTLPRGKSGKKSDSGNRRNGKDENGNDTGNWQKEQENDVNGNVAGLKNVLESPRNSDSVRS